MNLWLIAATVLLAGYVPCLWVCLRAPLLDALVATQLGTSVGVVVLLLVAEGLGRSISFVLPVVLAIAGVIGSLVFVRFYGERWL